MLLQSTDLGFEADEVEDLLLETEWYVCIHNRLLWQFAVFLNRGILRANIDTDEAKEIVGQIVKSIKSSMT